MTIERTSQICIIYMVEPFEKNLKEGARLILFNLRLMKKKIIEIYYHLKKISARPENAKLLKKVSQD